MELDDGSSFNSRKIIKNINNNNKKMAEIIAIEFVGWTNKNKNQPVGATSWILASIIFDSVHLRWIHNVEIIIKNTLPFNFFSVCVYGGKTVIFTAGE